MRLTNCGVLLRLPQISLRAHIAFLVISKKIEIPSLLYFVILIDIL